MINILKTTTGDLLSCLTQNPGSLYVGRGNGSPLGNPFRAKSKDLSDIAHVVACYRNYLNFIVQGWEPFHAASYCEMEYGAEIAEAWSNNRPSREKVIATLNMYVEVYVVQGSLNLVCFCIDRPWSKQEQYSECHAEVIAAAVQKLAEIKYGA